MTSNRYIRPLTTSIASLLFAFGASAATLEWDADGNGPASGGAGTWNTSGLNWTDGVGYQAWLNASNDTALFGGDAGGTVTIGTPVIVGGLAFQTPGYVLTGANISLGVIGTNTLVVDEDAVIESNILGDASTGLAISGVGTLVLKGTNTWAGATSILGTTVEIETFGDGTGGNLGAAGAITLNGGVIRYTGATGGTGRAFAVGTVQSGSTIEVVEATTTLTLSGALTGPARQYLHKTGDGTLVLSGTGDNSGGRVTLDAGTLILGKASAAAVHSVGSQGNDDYALVINGGVARLEGTGGDQIYVNSSVNMTGGVLDMNGRNEAFSQLFGTAGVVRNSAAATTSTLTLGENNGTAEFSGVIEDGAGTLALAKVGTGTVTLSGDNTYTGGTTVNAGMLLATRPDSLPGYQTAGKVVVNSGGGIAVRVGGDGWSPSNLQTLRSSATFNAGSGLGIDTTNGDFTYSEALEGDLFFAKMGDNTLTLSGNNTFTGGVRVLGGVLRLGSATAFGTGPGTVTNGALDLNGFSIATTSLNGAAAGELMNSSDTDSTVTINLPAGAVGSFAGLISTLGEGKLNLVFNMLPSANGSNYSLNSVNDFVGSVTVNGVGDKLGTRGVLGIPQSGGLGDPSNVLTLHDGGTLSNLSNPNTGGGWPNFGIPTLDNPIVLTGASGGVFRAGYVNDGGGIILNGVISGPGGLTKTDGGYVLLNGENTYEGETRISAGSLRVGNGGTTGSLPAASQVVFGSGTGNMLVIDRSDESVLPNRIDKGGRANITVPGEEQVVNYTGAVTGTGEFWVSGPGTFVVTPNAGTSGTGSIVTNKGLILELSDFSSQTLGEGNFFLGQGGTEATLRYTGPSTSTGRLTGGTFQGSEVTLEVTNPEATLTLTGALGNNANGLGPTVKEGPGTLAFTGTNTYVGGTIIAEGALLVNNTSGSGTGTGPVEVLQGGILGGTGTIAPTGTSPIDIAGILAPGVEIGTLTFNLSNTAGQILLTEDASFRFDLGTPGTPDFPGAGDRILLTGAEDGDFTFANNVIDFGATGEEGWYRLFSTNHTALTWSGLTIDAQNIITGGLSFTNLAPGFTADLVMGNGTLGVAGHIYLHVVPEPGSAMLLLGATGALLGFRRRRSK